MLKKRILLLLLILAVAAPLAAQNKTALVIGNSAYRHFPKLQQPWREAGEVKAALERLGFDVVYLVDGSYDRMYDALAAFETRLQQRGGIAFFHYGGHGLQVDGENYLLPVDKEIPDELRVKSRAMNVSEVVSLMAAAGSSTNIVVLDACRDNPLPAQVRSANSRGLARLNAPVNTIVVYSAEAGGTAEDGVFTPTLLEYLETPGMGINEVMMNVRRAVWERTGGRQVPGEYSQLFEPVYLAGAAAKSIAAPGGFVLVKAGTFTMGSPAGELYRYDNEAQHSVRITKDFYMSSYEITQAEYRSIMGTNPSSFRGDNLPVEKVSWYEAVEYCNRRSEREGLTPCYSGSGDSIRCDFTADGYRLPTEAEWEYAARGGKRAGDYNLYAGSDSIGGVAWYDGNVGNKTHPVGQKEPNELGLYDMTGNVWEWCWDRYGTYASDSVTDPEGPAAGPYRVRRGGGWGNGARDCRVAGRGGANPSGRVFYLGFRVVRLP